MDVFETVSVFLLLFTTGSVAGVFLTSWIIRRNSRALFFEADIENDPATSSEPIPDANKVCENCAHWDLEEMQETIRRSPYFAAAAEHLSPNDMSKPKRDSEGTVIPEKTKVAKRLPVKEDKWARMGACLSHEEGRHALDNCERWESMHDSSGSGSNNLRQLHG